MKRTSIILIVLVQIALTTLIVCLKHPPFFLMDDGYIYANYVSNAGLGHFFEYNLGEKSGGITSPLWYFMWTALFSCFRSVLSVKDALHVSGFVLSALFLQATALVIFLFARQVYKSRWVASCAGLFVVCDWYLQWGALSGLEIPLTVFVMSASLWAAWNLDVSDACTLEQNHYAICSRRALIVLSFFAYWSRPELIVWMLAIICFFVVRQVFSRDLMRDYRTPLFMFVALMLGAMAAGALYQSMTGRILPSSFYAKVNVGLNISSLLGNINKFLHDLTFSEAITLAAFGWACIWRWSRGDRLRMWLLPLFAVGAFLISKLATLPWLGQEHRYISPLRPVMFLFAICPFLLFFRMSLNHDVDVDMYRSRKPLFISRFAPLMAISILMIFGYSEYLLNVSRPTFWYWLNCRKEGDVSVGLWLRDHIPTNAIVASEPIGSIHLFSERFTIDVVGLTSNDFLGLYPAWDRIMPMLRKRKADYIVYYPKWFQRNGVNPLPVWLERVASFQVGDGSVEPIGIGSWPIEIYHLNWALYADLSANKGG